MTTSMLIPNGVPLASVPGLTGEQIKTLSDSWLVTAQEFVALGSANAALRDRLASALNITRAALDPLVAAAKATIPETRDLRSAQIELEAAQAEYGLGALLDEPGLAASFALPNYELPEGRAVLPTSHSLLDQLPAVRNQGGRGTCVAHAVTAVREQLEIAAGSPDDLNLSEQYVYWWCKGKDGIPKVSGTYVSVGMRCLNEAGAPLEETWPYVGNETGDQGQGPPPPAAANGEPAFRTLQTQEIKRTDIDGIRACLYEGRAVAFSIPVFDSWYSSAATSRWGKITLPLPGEPQNGGHAMTLVGYQDDVDAPGGGYFLVRNSWQPWSWDGVWREGYGEIPYAYISRYATAVFSARRITGGGVYLRDRADETQPRTAAALTWNSPDIWIRQEADGGVAPQPLLPGQANAVYVRAFNRGPTYAYDVGVEVFAAPAAPYIDPRSWTRIGRQRLPWLKPGETVLKPLTWTPSTAGPFALLVRLLAAHAQSDERAAGDSFDPAAGENVAQRNLWQTSAYAGGTLEVAFDLTGAAGKPGAVSLRVERGDLPADAVISPITLGPATDAARGIVSDAILGMLTGAVLLEAGQHRRASLTVTLPATTQPGVQQTWGIVQSQGGVPVGRLTVQMTVAA